jgi:hypothetical protein
VLKGPVHAAPGGEPADDAVILFQTMAFLNIVNPVGASYLFKGFAVPFMGNQGDIGPVSNAMVKVVAHKGNRSPFRIALFHDQQYIRQIVRFHIRSPLGFRVLSESPGRKAGYRFERVLVGDVYPFLFFVPENGGSGGGFKIRMVGYLNRVPGAVLAIRCFKDIGRISL